MTIGEKIRSLRQKAGLSQSQLADALTVSRAAVAKWENENGTPDIENLKALAAYFGYDVDFMLDETKSISNLPSASTEQVWKPEDTESFCGKSCSRCEFREPLNCGGCREGEGRRYGPCRVAQCCRDQGHLSCRFCSQRPSCLKSRDLPGQQDAKMKRRYTTLLKTKRVAPVLGKWLWVLFCLILIQTVADILCQDFIKNWLPWLKTTGEIIMIVCGVLYGLILICCSSVTTYYRTAGICGFVVSLLDVVNMLIPDGSEGFVLISLAVMPLALVARYNEYMGHAYALEGIDDELSASWAKLWKWFIGLYIAMFGSVLFGPLLLILVLLGILGLGIYQLVLLYRTADLFQEYCI